MSQYSLTEAELEFLIHGFEFSYAQERWPFLRFVAVGICRAGILISFGEKGHMEERSDWCKQFINDSIKAYTPRISFSDMEWMSQPGFVAETVQPFVLFIAAVARYRMLKAYKNERMEEQDAVNTMALAEKAENMEASTAATSKPKPPICFTGYPVFPENTRPSDYIRFYYYSLPSFANFLQTVRKRYELKPGDKITMLRVETGGCRLRVMVDEEQELWDWEEAMGAIHNGRATIVFEVDLE